MLIRPAEPAAPRSFGRRRLATRTQSVGGASRPALSRSVGRSAEPCAPRSCDRGRLATRARSVDGASRPHSVGQRSLARPTHSAGGLARHTYSVGGASRGTHSAGATWREKDSRCSAGESASTFDTNSAGNDVTTSNSPIGTAECTTWSSYTVTTLMD